MFVPGACWKSTTRGNMKKNQEKYQVDWDKSLYDKFVERAMLNKEEQFIMKNRILGMYVSEMARELDTSESSIHRKIALLKKKYDRVQKLYDDMPVRRESEKERIMDEN